MMLRCPRCRQKVSVAEKYAGKAVRCPSCNRGFAVPKLQASVGSSDSDSGPELEELARLESSSGVLSKRELSRVQASLAPKKSDDDSGSVRVCPNCKKEVLGKDPYADVLCSNCWQPIPALVKGGSSAAGIAAARARRAAKEGPAIFYAELTSCLAYPIPALGSILGAAVIAIVAALAPVALITAGIKVMEQYAVGTAQGVGLGDLSRVTLLLMAIFGLEIFLFSAIAVHLFLDVVRTTAIKNDQPPSLSWGPRKWGKSFFTYLLFVLYVALMVYLLATFTVRGDVVKMLLSGHFKDVIASGGTILIVGLVVICLGIPMGLIGIALTSALQGLNPVNVATSVARTHVHYVFLVVLLSVYGIMFGAAFATILFDWFLPGFDKMVKGSAEGDLVQVALSLLAWGAVMGFFYYGTYVLARLHGQFARSFRKSLAFGM
jgi:DNA-directed RNA polymerase subunit RPC12/RpoP